MWGCKDVGVWGDVRMWRGVGGCGGAWVDGDVGMRDVGGWGCGMWGCGEGGCGMWGFGDVGFWGRGTGPCPHSALRSPWC